MSVSTRPASASVRWFTDRNISVTNESAATNAIESRNAAAAAAGRPGLAVSVPGGTIRRSGGRATARPTSTSGTVQTEGSIVRPARNTPAPSASTSGGSIAMRRSRSPTESWSAGNTSTAATTSTGSGDANAHRQPAVATSTAPSGGPSKPGRIHIAASSASTRGRMFAG